MNQQRQMMSKAKRMGKVFNHSKFTQLATLEHYTTVTCYMSYTGFSEKKKMSVFSKIKRKINIDPISSFFQDNQQKRIPKRMYNFEKIL